MRGLQSNSKALIARRMWPFDASTSTVASTGQGLDTELNIPVIIQSVNKMTVEAVKCVLNLVYKDRPYARFAALETIARVPYFSYTSVLHLYETPGWMRRKEYIQIHFAEGWNELHHLLIMEALGGNKEPFDRFVAQNIAFFYYWMVVALYMVSPAVAYDLNKHVEEHAHAAYLQFLTENEAELRRLPAPQVAKDYYQDGDLYMFDAFQYSQVFKQQQAPTPGAKDHSAEGMALPTKDSVEAVETSAATSTRINKKKNKNSRTGKKSDPKSTATGNINMSNNNSRNSANEWDSRQRRRPVVETLYDVFVNVCADEAEHADTMRLLQRDACLRMRGAESRESSSI